MMFKTDNGLTADQLYRATGGVLANPTFRITVFGYGFEVNKASVCKVTPDGGVCKNISKE